MSATAPTTIDEAPRYERVKVILAGICAVILTVGIARFAYTPMLPVMQSEAGLTKLAGGWLATFNYAGYMAGVLMAAFLKDLEHKYRLCRLGLLVALISTVGMGLTENQYLWVLWRFIAGLSSIAGVLLSAGLVLHWLMHRGHKPELGLHFSGLGLGIMVSGLAVAAMDGNLSWEQQWIGLALIGLAFFVPAWIWMPKPLTAAMDKHPTIIAAPPPPRRWMWLFIAAYFCAGFGYVVSSTFIVAIVEAQPVMAGRGNWVWVILGISAIPSCFFWDKISAWKGQVAALLLAFVLQTVAIVLPALDDGTLSSMVSAILFGNTFVGIVSLTLSLIGRCFPANPAKAMARLTLSYGVAMVAAPAMAGAIASVTGNYSGALWGTAAVMLVGIGFLLAMLTKWGNS